MLSKSPTRVRSCRKPNRNFHRHLISKGLDRQKWQLWPKYRIRLSVLANEFSIWKRKATNQGAVLRNRSKLMISTKSYLTTRWWVRHQNPKTIYQRRESKSDLVRGKSALIRSTNHPQKGKEATLTWIQANWGTLQRTKWFLQREKRLIKQTRAVHNQSLSQITMTNTSHAGNLPHRMPSIASLLTTSNQMRDQ